MKPASEIHAEVGGVIDHEYDYNPLIIRAFTISDITKIIEDVKEESVDQFIDGLTTVLESHGFNATDWDGEDAPHVVVGNAIAGLINNVKAEAKGVCEWNKDTHIYNATSCDRSYYIQLGKFCPGCGKEIKVV
jgi:uncharacterized protein YejL (UPF0352 family)